MNQDEIDASFAAMIAAEEASEPDNGPQETLFSRDDDVVMFEHPHVGEVLVYLVDEYADIVEAGNVLVSRLNQPMYDDVAEQFDFVERNGNVVEAQRIADCETTQAALAAGSFLIQDADAILRTLNGIKFLAIGEFDPADAESENFYADTPTGRAALLCAMVTEALIDVLGDD